MKKNIMMRIAAVMMIAVLLSTCAISGTFAKYITEAEGNDTARVAKWGISITAGTKGVDGNSLFSKQYDNTSNPTVATGANDLVVAPGTANSEGTTFTISGTPEVDVKLTVAMTGSAGTGSAQDIVLLKKATDDDSESEATAYTDYTKESGSSEKFTLEKDYYPVVFTLTHTNHGTNSLGNKMDTVTGTLADVEKALEAYLNDKTIEANETLDEVFKLTWAWDFDDTGAGTNDKADTYLGMAAANETALPGATTSLNYAITITATQIN